ncbi:hypothetical protein TNCV_2830741 [Trichonephila clavipes]|nr:hypothetical protein TNCV_2830741 [Trichonephila clavipes]
MDWKSSGEHAAQGNSRTFSFSRKVRTIPAACGRVISCLNLGFHRIGTNSRATGLNTPEMFIFDPIIEDASFCDAASRVAAAIVSELRVHAAETSSNCS